MRSLLFSVALLVLIAGCVTKERIDQRYGELVARWEVENPSIELNDAVKERLYAEAAVQVHREVAKERAEAGEKTAGLVTSILSGNWIGAAFAGLGLAGLGFSAYKKGKGGV